MTRVKSQIQHDYKSLVNPSRHDDTGARGRRWFFLGLVLPVLIVAGVLFLSPGNASPTSGAPTAAPAAQPDTRPAERNDAPQTAAAVKSAPAKAAEAAPMPGTDVESARDDDGDRTVRRLALPPRPDDEPDVVKVADQPTEAPSPATADAEKPLPDATPASASTESTAEADPTDERVALALPTTPSTPAAADPSVDVTEQTEPAPTDASTRTPETAASNDDNVTRTLALPPRRNAAQPEMTLEKKLPGEPLTLTVKSGDSLDLLFGRHDLSRGDLATLLTLPEAQEALTLLMPGDQILVRRDGASILGLTRALDEVRTLHVTRHDDGFATHIEERPVEIRIQHASATISSSLFLAAKAAGISDT
ncbi:MAG: hypothetical protein AAFU65_07650, partial [Pseudomonadota bacterium]